MKLVSFFQDGNERAGVWLESAVLDVNKAALEGRFAAASQFNARDPHPRISLLWRMLQSH